jgi:hypothetical protein
MLSGSASMSNLPSPTPQSSFFGWSNRPASTSPVLSVGEEIVEDGPVDELIIAGTAFGIFRYRFLRLPLTDFGVCRIRIVQPRHCPPPQEGPVSYPSCEIITHNSLIEINRSVVGFLGFKHDRRLALKLLELSAEKGDVHSTFAGLVFTTLLLFLLW